MSSQLAPFHHRNSNAFVNPANKNDKSFDPFNYTTGQDRHIRWLSRPKQLLVRERYPDELEKFRISFDVENFQPEQIKIYIENHKLTIRGVYEERTEECFMQKEFEKSFDLPYNADIELMACFITPGQLLVVEIPLNPDVSRLSTQMDLLSVSNDPNQRRLSFSLNKFNELNKRGSVSPSSNFSALPPPGQQVRRTSMTKTTTTTTTKGSAGISPEIEALLRSVDMPTDTTNSYNTRVTERRVSNSGNQLMLNPSNPSSTVTSTSSTLSNLADLPIEIPPELLATGGTITIQKRKVSVTKSTDPSLTQAAQLAMINNNDKNSSVSTTTTTSVQSQLPPSVTTERRSSHTISTNTQHKKLSLEEFLQNKIWNPSIENGPYGKKILHMRLHMNPGTTADQLKILLKGFDLSVEVQNKGAKNIGQTMNGQSYRQISLFPTCEVEHLTTELRNDGFLHIQVPIQI